MGGIETLALLRKADPAVRAIASSGYSSDTVMAEPRAHGFLDRLTKPYTTAELSEVLSRTLRGTAPSTGGL
jgi:CheY-like chemotaxis protein